MNLDDYVVRLVTSSLANGGCSNCGGLPHTDTCLVGRLCAACRPPALNALTTLAKELSATWDHGSDVRLGKMLGALAGKTGYRADIDKLREMLR